MTAWEPQYALAAMLQPRGLFRTIAGAGAEEEGTFANHCTHCGAVQEDYTLHSEPGSIELTAVEGQIQVSGDWGFGV